MFLECFEQLRYLPHYTFVRAKLHILVQDDREIEDELIARVLAVIKHHRVAQDPVFICTDRHKSVAESLFRDYVLGDSVEIEERRGRVGAGGDGAIGDLVDYLGAWIGVS